MLQASYNEKINYSNIQHFQKIENFLLTTISSNLTHPSYLKIRIAVRNARFERHLSWGVNVPFLLIFFRCEG